MTVDAVVEQITDWMYAYLAQPHPSMNRAGAICPFVEPALEAGALEFRTVSSLSPDPERYVAEATRRAMDQFPPSDLEDQKKTLRALVLLFPDLRGRGRIIDRVHAVLKDRAVEQGIMLGQLHPECPEPSARNVRFAVNRSPVPLFAIRHMAMHDILFLKGDRSWFVQYDRRFGHLFDDGARVDAVLRAEYDQAVADHGLAHRDPESAGLAGAS